MAVWKTRPSQVKTSQSFNKQINHVNLHSYYYVTGKIILGRQLGAILNIIIAANSALKSSAPFWNNTNWQKDDISVLAAVSDKICSTLGRGVHNILISSPLESILGLCLSSSQLVFSPVILEFQLAFLGLMNQICDLVLASLLSCWLISFFLEMRWKSQTFSFIYLLQTNTAIRKWTLRCSPCWRTCGALPLLSCSLSAIAYFRSADRLLWSPRTWFLLFHDSVCPVAAETEEKKNKEFESWLLKRPHRYTDFYICFASTRQNYT